MTDDSASPEALDRPPHGDEGSAHAAEVRRLRAAIRAREALLEERERQLVEKTELVRSMTASRSWRLTRPLRAATELRRRASAVRGGRSLEHDALEAMFDPEWYARRYGAVGPSETLLDDYLSSGWREGRDPMPLLDGAWYAAQYQGRPSDTSPLEDFVAHASERRPNRWFDPALWNRLPDRAAPDVVTYLGGVAVDLHREAADSALGVVSGASELEDGCAACVFVHYDTEGRFDPHVASTVAALARCGRRVVVCSTSPALDTATSEGLRDHVAFVLSVPNTGHDWGAYHAGLGFVLGRCAPRSVTFMNDSVYVVPEALHAFLERVDGTPADVVGATDSLMFRYHLQSYFLHLGRSALDSALTKEFLSTYVAVADKHYVINAYEIGFSRRAAAHGLALEAVFPYEELAGAVGRELSRSEFAPNPTLDLWDVLLEQGSPFVKRQLLRDMAPDPARLRELVPAETLRLAEAHLARMDVGGDRSSAQAAAGERP